MARIDKNNYYLDIAEREMEHGNLMDRNYGAIIVKDDVIVSKGYSYMFMQNGSPAGSKQHAETTAINSASKELILGGTLYLVGRDMQTGELLSDTEPCLMCMRNIIKSGITWMVCRVSSEVYKTVYVGLNQMENK